MKVFGIIICGYLAGRFDIVTNSEVKGLGTYVGKFALPSVIFLKLCAIKWDTVNWTFVAGITMSKTIVFLLVIVVVFMSSRPRKFGRAGVFAIFCTQGNDFAIGNVIIEALYESQEIRSYIYLLSPISFAILNPIGVILMEVGNYKKMQEETKV
jgi:predicted permease